MPPRLKADLDQAALEEGLPVSEFVRRAVAKQVGHRNRTGESTYQFREVQVVPFGDLTPESVLESIAHHHHVTLADIAPGGSELPVSVKKAAKRVLTPVQFRRFMSVVIRGAHPIELAAEEGCSRQAIYKTLKAVSERLRADSGFRAALDGVFNREEHDGEA